MAMPRIPSNSSIRTLDSLPRGARFCAIVGPSPAPGIGFIHMSKLDGLCWAWEITFFGPQRRSLRLKNVMKYAAPAGSLFRTSHAGKTDHPFTSSRVSHFPDIRIVSDCARAHQGALGGRIVVWQRCRYPGERGPAGYQSDRRRRYLAGGHGAPFLLGATAIVRHQ